MQRFFSTFPGGRPGAGLLLLRVMAGGTVLVEGTLYLTHAEPTVAAWGVGLPAVIGGAALIAGFLTPMAATVVTATTLFVVSMGWPGLALLIADAVALALLGPGAHSVDAFLFGRREIIISRGDFS